MADVMCEATTYETYTSYRCDRPAKGEHNGKHLCGPHLAGAKRAAAAREKRDARYAKEGRDRELAKQRAVLASAYFGEECKPYWSAISKRYEPEFVVVPWAAIERAEQEGGDDGARD